MDSDGRRQTRYVRDAALAAARWPCRYQPAELNSTTQFLFGGAVHHATKGCLCPSCVCWEWG